jgi:hypothetical protein
MFTISVSRLGGEEQDGLLEGAGGGAKKWRSGDSKSTAKNVPPLLGPMFKKRKNKHTSTYKCFLYRGLPGIM